MKKNVFAIVLLFTFQVVVAQKGAFKIGFRLAPGVNVATVNDNDGTPSDINYVADGFTTKEENAGVVGVSFYFDYFLSDHWAFSSGLWLTQKNFVIRNTDGNYSGVSRYNANYLQLPILFKYYTSELFKGFRVYGCFGPTIDFRTGEKLDGNDYAHYWNMSRHLTYNDRHRGRNASGRVVKLFNPIDITLFASAGISYEVIDRLEIVGGIFFNKGFVNAINPKLRFDEPSQTRVNTDVSWKSFLIGMELGVTYNLTK